MDYIEIAIIAAVVNLFLSILVPCLSKKINLPKSSLLSEIKKTITNNREALLMSSLLVGIIVFLSLDSSKSNMENNEMIELNRLFNLGTFDLVNKSNMPNMSNTRF
jgi:hypothetical protein